MLSTDRLRLRLFRATDHEACRSWLSDEEVARFSPHGVEDDAGIECFLRGVCRRWDRDGLTQLAVEENGAVIGECGLMVQLVEGTSEVELSYRLRRDRWGHGLATEAARAVLRWGLLERGVAEVIALIHDGNERSIRLAERVGLRRDRRVPYPGEGVVHLYRGATRGEEPNEGLRA